MFQRERVRALRSLLRAIETGLVDPDLIPLLSLINSLQGYYSTSSCSGRIQLAATHLPGEKFKMIVLSKWHRPIEEWELKQTLSASKHSDLWLSVQGPILHIACRDLNCSLNLLEASRKAGLKHSGILWIGDRIIVEVTASDKIECPLRLKGRPLLKEEMIPHFVERINEVLIRAKNRISRLEEEIRKLASQETS